MYPQTLCMSVRPLYVTAQLWKKKNTHEKRTMFLVAKPNHSRASTFLKKSQTKTMKGSTTTTKSHDDDSAIYYKIGTGASPCIRPKPKYPSVFEIILHFIHHYIIHQCMIGTMMVYWLTPLYYKSRSSSSILFNNNNNDEMNINNDDAWYFSIVLSMIHTGMYVFVNLRE